MRRFLTFSLLSLAALVASARTEGSLSWWLLLAAVWLHPVPGSAVDDVAKRVQALEEKDKGSS